MLDCKVERNCNHKHCNDDFCIRKYRLDALFNYSMLSTAQMNKISLHVDADKTDYDEFVQLAEIEANIVDFVNNGNNLYLYSSNCGNGKTSWAIRMIQNYIYKTWITSRLGCTALFVDVTKFLQALKDNISNRNEYAEYIKANVMKADLVVWDDIASKAGTDYEINQLFGLINDRLNNGKSNIYTSNVDNKALYNILGERITSRIFNNSKCICLHGSDKRGCDDGGNK